MAEFSTTWAGTVIGTVSQTYDDDFRVASQTVSGGTTEVFAYDQDGLLSQAGAETLLRDPATGLLTGTTLGTVTTSQGYNAFGELTSDSASAGATALYANTYTRDTLGRITQKVETIQGVTTTFGYVYDLAGRLERVDENGVPARTYAYDGNGNRLSVTEGATVTSGTYDSQDRLLTYGTNTYTYNLAGDLTSKTDSSLPSGQQTTSYSYDALGNLIQVVLPDATTIDYVIDGQNRRIGKKVNGTLVQAFVYQDQLNPAAEFDGAGNLVARFVYGTLPNIPDFIEKGGVTYRVLADHLGSPRLVINTATNAVAQRLSFDEFGWVAQDTNPGFQPFGFAGGLLDADSQLTRFGARDYDSLLGRWSTKDQLRFGGQDSNLYGYSLADPVNFRDPSGFLTLKFPVQSPAAATKLINTVLGAARSGGGQVPLSALLSAAGIPPSAANAINKARGNVTLQCSGGEENGAFAGTFSNSGEPLNHDIPGPGGLMLAPSFSGNFTVAPGQLNLNNIQGLKYNAPGPFNPSIKSIKVTPNNVSISI